MTMTAVGGQRQPVAAPKPMAAPQPVAAEKPAEHSNANVRPEDKAGAAAVENAGEKERGGRSRRQEAQTVSDEYIKKAVEQINKKTMARSEAVFGIHEGTNRVTIKIVDQETKKIIKEIPPEKTLDMIAKVWEIAGILIDERR